MLWACLILVLGFFLLKFQRGNCNYGEHNHFAQGIGDLRHSLEGFCFLIPFDMRTTLAEFAGEESYGECPYAGRCLFIHQEGVGLGRISVAINIVNGGTAPTGADRSSDGQGFNAGDKLQGYESRQDGGQGCVFKWRTTGSCRFGLHCSFAHGESELQKRVWGKASECPSTLKQPALSKQWVFKWSDVEKINRIYADWLPSTLLLDGSSGTMGG